MAFKTISDYKQLSILNLFDTNVETIENCPILHSLTISNNQLLKTLILPSVQECSIIRVSSLHDIDIENAEIAHLNNLPALNTINLPNVKLLTMSNMNIHSDSICINTMKSLRALHLDNVNGVDVQEMVWLEGINCLRISNCDITTLSNITSYSELTITNCSKLESIDTIVHVNNLTVDNCSSLASIDNCSNISMMKISRCNAFKHIADVEIENLTIEYCFKLIHLNSILVETLDVSFCPRIVSISLNPDTLQFTLNNCIMFDALEFDCDKAFCYASLRINLIGDNMIENIKDWFASSLIISDNNTLETVSNVYNLHELSLVNCHELNSISDTFIIDSLYISKCPILDSITNVYGYTSLDIIGCEELKAFDVEHTKLLSLTIERCRDLLLHVNGVSLEQLTLIGCGLITIENIDKKANIMIQNAAFHPNLSSVPNRVGSIYFEATKKFISHMNNLFKSAQVISKRFNLYNDRSKYLKFINLKQKNRITDCVICQETIPVELSIITRCEHMYHSECLNTWVRTRRSCPLCNLEL